MVWKKKLYTHHFKSEWNLNFYPNYQKGDRRTSKYQRWQNYKTFGPWNDLLISTVPEIFFSSKCIKFICVIVTELSHFIFLRVSVFIRNSNHKTRVGFVNFLIYTLSSYTVDRQLINVIPLLTKSNQAFGKPNGGKLGSIQNLKSLWPKTNKKK